MKTFLRPVPGRRARGPSRAALAALLLLAAGTAAADARSDAAARFGARVDFAVRVVLDDPATPAEGARLVWKSRAPGFGARADTALEAVAGPDGSARFEGVSFASPEISAEAPGAYPATARATLDLPDGADAWTVRPASGAPWLPDGSLRLRSVRAPHPMARSELPAPRDLSAAPAGFDAEKGAFLPPLGDGETADFFVEGGATSSPWPGVDYVWIVFRPAPGGALAEAPDRGDALRLPREAPADGWSEEPLRFFEARQAHGSAPAGLQQLWSSAAGRSPRPADPDAAAPREAPPAGSVLFRSRVRRGADGAVEAARYGAVLPWHAGRMDESFLVFFNATENERSLEPEELP